MTSKVQFSTADSMIITFSFIISQDLEFPKKRYLGVSDSRVDLISSDEKHYYN